MDENEDKTDSFVYRRIWEAGGAVPFTEFSRIALYDPEEGYYRREAKRVGADRQADFQTNLAVRSVFAPLVLEAVKSLLGDHDLGDYSFVEVGAEPDGALLQNTEDNPFRSTETVRVGDLIPELDGPTILFANEWLDAQPFVRVVFDGKRWMERFVEARGDRSLQEIWRAPESEEAVSLVPSLPKVAPEGYSIDLSLAAESILKRYLQGNWSGLFLTVDYGSSWEALTASLPGGTARAYYRHRQVEDLLARPGGQDLTCNVCWDRLAAVLTANGFSVGGPQRQEAFFLEKAAGKIRKIIEGGDSSDAAASRAKLMQLLNPSHFGAAFQVLWGIR